VSAGASPTPVRSASKAGIFAFVFVMYSYTTGGPFGLEAQVTTSGPGLTLLYHLVIPFFWCIPISLVAAELTTAMPVQGGFYRWVRAAFGDFWGFLAGWWNWTASFLLGSAYAVLFADYLSGWFPAMPGWCHTLIAVSLVALVTWINVRGIQLVGRISAALEILVLLPILVMTAAGLAHWRHTPFLPFTPPGKPWHQVFGVGLALGVWLYSGYEQLSSVAGEVDNPRRNYPLALSIVVPMSMATYFLPTLASLASLGNWQDWGDGYFTTAAGLLGGPLLALAVTIAAMIANVSLLNATMLATTRMPFAMAEDGFLPVKLTALHKRYGTPAAAIVASGIVYAFLTVRNLAELITVYAWLRVATSLLTALSAWKLRRLRPAMERPFVIPGGKPGLFYAVAAPVFMGLVALAGSILGAGHFVRVWGPVGILLGPAVYLFLRRSPR
jgi:amino acid transporter